MALKFRTIDGSGNNLDNPEFDNATGTSLQRLTEAHPEAVNDPLSTREISNIVVGRGDATLPNPQGLSELFTTWGQFTDHTLDLLRSDPAQPINIPIPLDDQTFPPGSVLPVNRTILNPDGEARNNLTGWLDASMVYGSSQATLDKLRSPDGHMLLGPSGDELPPAGAGDVRATENDYLTSLHVLFLKEHNRLVDEFAAEDPTLTGDQLFDKARAFVDAEIANITLNDWLPHVLGHELNPYAGYDSNVDARESVEFVTAAFRFGHSMVGDDIDRLDEAGNILQTKDLATDFVDGRAGFADFGGSGALLRAQADEAGFALDARINDDLRNFLVDGGPVSDLAAINLQRGRDLGVGTLNEVREDLGLNPYHSFRQLTGDKETAAALKEIYGDIDNVELWVGGLAERTKGDALVGPTFGAILEQQFEALRDGDRFYFENATEDGPGFTPQEIAGIKETTLADIILRNTNTQNIQSDVFVAVERSDLGNTAMEAIPDLSSIFTQATAAFNPAPSPSPPAGLLQEPPQQPILTPSHA